MAKAIADEVTSIFSAINGGVIDISDKQIVISLWFASGNQATKKLPSLGQGFLTAQVTPSFRAETKQPKNYRALVSILTEIKLKNGIYG